MYKLKQTKWPIDMNTTYECVHNFFLFVNVHTCQFSPIQSPLKHTIPSAILVYLFQPSSPNFLHVDAINGWPQSSEAYWGLCWASMIEPFAKFRLLNIQIFLMDEWMTLPNMYGLFFLIDLLFSTVFESHFLDTP